MSKQARMVWQCCIAGFTWLALATTAMAQTTTVEYIHTDALGSPVAVTNAAGAVVERQVYEPYGAGVTHGPNDGPGFTGHVEDSATDLSYMQQRYYDPDLGIFLSVDPVAAYEKPGQSFGRYDYALNNPYRFTDPDGRQSREDVNPPSTGIPFIDWLMTPSDARGSQSQMMERQFASELSQPHSAKDVALYTAIALSAGTGAAGEALSGTSAARGTTLYRVVDDAEYGSIMKLGRFSESPNGDGVKRFLDNLSDAKALQSKFSEFFGGNQTVVEGVAPEEVMNSATRTPFSDVPGRPMNSVNIPSNKVEKVMCTGSHIKQTGC